MPASTAEFVMSYLTDGRHRQWPVHVDLVIEELDSWVNPDGALALTSACLSGMSDTLPVEVAVP